MDIHDSNSTYLMMMYVYLKSYEEAIKDFEYALENTGFGDVALKSIKQIYEQRIEKVTKELSQ
jgi:uncharacterized protein (DUF302 family)